MALDLVKGFSTKSFVSKRLWKTIKGLKEVGPKLGLSLSTMGDGHINPGLNAEDPHSNAALAMAGLAGHEISGMGNGYGASGGVGGDSGMGNSPMNGFQMSCEMTNLFEAALGSVGLNGNGSGSGNGGGGGGNSGYVPIQDGDALAGIGSNVFGGDEELYKQLRDLF